MAGYHAQKLLSRFKNDHVPVFVHYGDRFDAMSIDEIEEEVHKHLRGKYEEVSVTFITAE